VRPKRLPRDATGDALQRLVDHGSDLDRPMQIDFAVAVPTREAARHVAREARRRGYATDITHDQLGDDDFPWSCYCTRTLVPSYRNVCAAEAELDAIARPVGGHADGFGSFGNAEEEAP
jgi:hypothetical protein